MIILKRIASVVRWLLQRKRAEQELDNELLAYLELSASEKVRNGIPPSEARRLAAIELGGIEQIKERVRTRRYGAFLDEVCSDLRYALRILGRQPGFTSVIVLTLAIGIGANTAIFSLIDALMLRLLPVPTAQELLQVQIQAPDSRQPSDTFSYAIVRGLADQNEIFEGVAGFNATSFNTGSPGSLTRVSGAMVTGQYYKTLGLNPVVGRLITTDDDKPDAPLVAVISYGYWARQFALDPAVIGRHMPVNGVPVTIIGISPPGFVGANVGSTADVTMAAATLTQVAPESAPLLGPGNFWLRALARLKAGVSIPLAEARLTSVWLQMAETMIAPHWPPARRKEMADSVFRFTPGGTGWTYLRVMYREPLLVLMAMVALVLLIACANTASLLLARASVRQREMAVRLAIGAGRGRLIRQLLIESTLLSAFGGAFGIGLAWLSSRFIVDMISTGPFPVAFDLTPNGNILLFTSIVSIVTGILFGLAPAVQITAAGPSPALKKDARMSGSRTRLLPSLVSAQVALSLVLLIGAGLFARTLKNLQDFDPGFDRQGVLLVDFEGRRTTLPKELLDEVRLLPGVVSASVSTHTPLSGAVWSEPAVPKGQPVPERDTAIFVGAGSRFFETMRIQLLSGREFTERDSSGNPDVAIVNEAFAQKYFPNQNSVGQHLSAIVRGRRTDLEIIGIARNTRATGLRTSPRSAVYVSYAQLTGDFPTTLEIRTNGDVDQVATAVRLLLQMKSPNFVNEVRAFSSQVEATLVQERMLATLAGGFGVIALALVCIGLYGLLAYSVARRTKEIGIRIALGSPLNSVIAMVMKGAVRLVLIGIAFGLPAAWAASRWVETMLFGLNPTDPAAMSVAILLLVTIALLAAYLPARRASRVNPLAALRHE